VLADAAVSVPEFRVVNLAESLVPQLEGLVFPCVAKPLSLSGSRGVIRADTQEQVLSACARIQALLAGESLHDEFAASHVLIEGFVPGPEVALEGLLNNGELEVLAIFDKPDPMEGPFFEETYYITPSRHSAANQADIISCARAACEALGLSEGPVHAEIRLSDKGSVVLEVASRTIGGECARLLSYGTGHSLESLVIAHATGKPLEIQAETGGAGVLMIPITGAGIMRRVEGITAARAVPFVEDILINIREGYELVPLPEGGSYLGFMFASAPTPEQAEAALRAAHAKLKIIVAPVMKFEDLRLK
jgi:biotin carboxylase